MKAKLTLHPGDDQARSKKRGKPSLIVGDGTNFLPLPFANPGTLITRTLPLGKLEKQSTGETTVITSSGQSYTLAELCTCTDYSSPATGQIAMSLNSPEQNCGIDCLLALDVLTCSQCSLKRPYKLTSLSTA